MGNKWRTELRKEAAETVRQELMSMSVISVSLCGSDNVILEKEFSSSIEQGRNTPPSGL